MSLRILIQGDGKASGKTELLRTVVSAIQKAGYSVKLLPDEYLRGKDFRVSELDELERLGFSYPEKMPCPFTEEGRENDGYEVSVLETNKP